MARKHFYVVLILTYEVMVIGQSEILDARYCSVVRKCYLSNLGFNFSIGIFRYRRGGSGSDWVVIFRTTQGASTSSTNFIKTISASLRESLSHLLRRHSSDGIASIRSTVDSNSRLATTLISTLLPDGTFPIFCDIKTKNEFVQYFSTCIQNRD